MRRRHNSRLKAKLQTKSMSPKEIAAHYEAKVFDSPAAAESAGFALTETLSPRNVWNKASAAQSIALKLREKKEKGEVKEIGLVIEPWSVTGCYVPNEIS
ncbi:MAG: hypothetical protein QOG23_4425 [Blastocatellia bacterium]|nr:hypothetical protein [Blastocatellia bacterium]